MTRIHGWALLALLAPLLALAPSSVAPAASSAPAPAAAAAAEDATDTTHLCWAEALTVICVRPDGGDRRTVELPAVSGAQEVLGLSPDVDRAVVTTNASALALAVVDLDTRAVDRMDLRPLLPPGVSINEIALNPDTTTIAALIRRDNPDTGLSIWGLQLIDLPTSAGGTPTTVTQVELPTSVSRMEDLVFSADGGSVLFRRADEREFPGSCPIEQRRTMISLGALSRTGQISTVEPEIQQTTFTYIGPPCGQFVSRADNMRIVGADGDLPVFSRTTDDRTQTKVTIDTQLRSGDIAWPGSTHREHSDFTTSPVTVTNTGTHVAAESRIITTDDGAVAAGIVRTSTDRTAISLPARLQTLDLRAAGANWRPVPLSEADQASAGAAHGVWPARFSQVAPVIFMPGVLGSEIWCDETAVAPIWPALGVSESFMLLAPDGVTNAGTCPDAGVRDAEYGGDHTLAAGGSGVAESLLGHDIYGDALRLLADTVGHDRFYAFGWDWRRDTAASVPRLDALVDQVLVETGAEQVQLVAHSYGGLLALDYASAPARRAKLARVTTVGTPYLGAPKSVFSLLTGSEAPFDVRDVGTMEFLFGGTDDLSTFARNLRGMFNLWPGPGYGPFLSAPTLAPDGPLDRDQTASLIDGFGGVSALWRAAQDKHTALWDRLDIGDLPWQLVVVGGQPTMRRGTFVPGTGDEPTRVGLTLAPGDGTVPLRSQTLLAADKERDVSLGRIGGTHPNLGISQMCFRKHSTQMSDPKLYALIGPWLVDGERPSADLDLPCRADTRIAVEVIDADLRPAVPAPRSAPRSATRRTASARTALDAEAAGEVEILRFGRQSTLLLDPEAPTRLTLAPAGDAPVRVGTTLIEGETITPLIAEVAAPAGAEIVLTAAGVLQVLDGATGAKLGEHDPRPPVVPQPPGPGAGPGVGPQAAQLTVRASSPQRGRVRLRVRLVAPAAALTGRVVVRRGGAKGPVVARGRIVNGALVLRIARQPHGRQRFRVSYRGNGELPALTRVARIRVR